MPPQSFSPSIASTRARHPAGPDAPAAPGQHGFARRRQQAAPPRQRQLLAFSSSAGEAHRLADQAANGLSRTRPELAAALPTWLWQKSLVFLCCIALGAGSVAAPSETKLALIALMTGPFLSVVLLRLAALAHALAQGFKRPEPDLPLARSDADLPRYSILVPLFRESAVLNTLIEALSALDYPAEKLEILLIAETRDRETHAALGALDLPPSVRVITVPPGSPRTKPRALNFALGFATGDFVTVFDAEDIPEPDQLRRALAAFDLGGSRLGCVQARLNIYNPRASWLTRQFTIEYSALFDIVLPTLERLGLPIPLGGTSNHFRRQALDAVGGWDAYNVTEDADLGLRLARFGWRVGVLASSTWEEAPSGFGNWFGQRTRWLKGWIRTYLVHMRQPWRVLRELGPAKFLGLQVLMTGLVAAPLVHPWFYALALAKLSGPDLFVMPSGALSDALWYAALFNVVAGYAAAILLGMVAVARRGHYALLLAAVWMPVYWLLISAAAYRALVDHLSRPHTWRKTHHFGRTSEPAGP